MWSIAVSSRRLVTSRWLWKPAYYASLRCKSSLILDKPSFEVNPMPDFDDALTTYSSKSTRELLRSALVFWLCRLPVAKHAESLLHTSRMMLGDRITDWLLQQTLYGHFCAGRQPQQAMERLQKSGIGSILDYAAEAESGGTKSSRLVDQITNDLTPKARVYDYESEAQCDNHVDIFKQCIQDGHDGFAAIKVTALGNPNLLERMSRAIEEARNLFRRFDTNGDGFVSPEEFEHGFSLYFNEDVKEHMHRMEPNSDGMIDYISWSLLLEPRDLPKLTAGCRTVGPLALAAPTEEEVELMEAMFARGRALAQHALDHNTRLLIDAEQARFQPAIDNLVLDLQRAFNGGDVPIVYNTYQFYLKDALERLEMDVKRAERLRYRFGAKLVRGAYMESERALAKALGYPSPIHDTIQETHYSYNNAVKFLLDHSTTSDNQVEIMLATHNRESVELAIQVMNDLGVDRKDFTVSFAQLYGMRDALSFNLGKHGFRAYKYLPYGEIKLVMPYLIRRANENSAIASGTAQELSLILKEIRRRMFHGLSN